MSSLVSAPVTKNLAAHPRHKAVTVFWLFPFLIFNTLASVCFKESGTDEAHWLQYFIVGNIFGPISVIFLMILYKRMHANVASALAVGLGAIVVQITFVLLYEQNLSLWQWGGIALLIAGLALVMSGRADKSGGTENRQGAR